PAGSQRPHAEFAPAFAYNLKSVGSDRARGSQNRQSTHARRSVKKSAASFNLPDTRFLCTGRHGIFTVLLSLRGRIQIAGRASTPAAIAGWFSAAMAAPRAPSWMPGYNQRN